MKLGRITGESISEYHSSEAVSVSKLKVFRHSPNLYLRRFVTKEVPAPEPTPAMALGNAAGAMILEGEATFRSRYYAVPAGIGRQKTEHKLLRVQLAAQNPGKEELSAYDANAVDRMHASVLAHPVAAKLLAAGKPEITWRIKGASFFMQVRTDHWNDEGCEITKGEPFIVDLKTINELPEDDPDKIPKQVSDFWYHGQAWAYREVVSTVMKYPEEFRPRFFFIFVEKQEPYSVRVVELDDIALELGARQGADALKKLRQCHETGRWPRTWSDEITTISLPQYYVRKSLDATDPNLAEAV